MDILLTTVHTLAALFLIIVIIIQGGNSGGVGAAFGGGNSTGLFGASGATSFLGKVTYLMAGIFMVSSITLSVRTSTSGKTGLGKKLEQQAGEVKTDSAVPAGTTTPAAPVNEATPEAK